MNAELPPFWNRVHNSESASTIDHVITPLISFIVIIDCDPHETTKNGGGVDKLLHRYPL